MRRVRVPSGVAISWVSSEIAKPIRFSPQSTESRRPVRGRSELTPIPYCTMVAKNSLFDLVRFIRSSKNSMASTGGMSARKFRSK